jgi:hypothetical protein
MHFLSFFFLSSTYFIKPIIDFYRQLQQALFVRDVYAPMFFCDFINMCIVIGFYSNFGVSNFKIFFLKIFAPIHCFSS